MGNPQETPRKEPIMPNHDEHNDPDEESKDEAADDMHEVEEHYREMTKLGAEVEGEGEITP